MPQTPLQSPCIKVCAVDSKSGWCIGCGRTMAEIGGWVKLGETGRGKVLSLLPKRMEELRASGKAGTSP